MSLTIQCELCQKMYELSDRETHYAQFCGELVFESCIFPDCKKFEPCKREQFENHLLFQCASYSKKCRKCDLDLYKMYENNGFRESVSGHICKRDKQLFLWEALIIKSGKEESKNAFSETNDKV